MANLKLAPGEKLFTEHRTTIFRKEEFEYVHTGIIDSNGDTWTTTELDEANINQVYNQYRFKHGIPFPDEIIALRKHYGLSAAKMSEILGFGINQYRLYEEGDMPSISNGRTLVAIRDKQTFLALIDASKESLGEKDYNKIKKQISAAKDFAMSSSAPNPLSGYAALSIPKIATTVLYFIKEMDGVFVTKMNKLMFYADFLAYKRRGHGITGLEYNALQYGPVPKKWGAIYNSVPEVEMEEYIYPDSMSGVKLTSTANPDLTILDDEEIDVLKTIANRFRNVSAGTISEISHHEKGWLENHEAKNHIDYSYAFDLSLS